MRARTILGGVFSLVFVVGCGDDTNSGGAGAGANGGQGGIANGGTGGAGGSLNSTTSSTGGAGGDLPLAPPLRNPIDWADEDVALSALYIMGYEPFEPPTDTCSHCHSINRGLLTSWLDLTTNATNTCLSDTSLLTQDAAKLAIDCMRTNFGDETSPFSTHQVGVYASAAHLDWFAFAFDRAYGDAAPAVYDQFKSEVGMPKQNITPFTQFDFDVVAEWFARGLPLLADYVPDEPPPDPCVDTIDASLAGYVTPLATTGWRAKNAEDGLLMLGCAGAPTALDCLSSYPLASSTAFGAAWDNLPGTSLRVLRTNNYSSEYWTRSSADGRYVGHGGGSNSSATIVDLLTNTEIKVDALYDPGFFPDNSAFMFQGSNGTNICQQTLLATDPFISFSEPQCGSAVQVGLYQAIGTALGGGDYWAIAGTFVSDNGGKVPTLDNPSAYFGAETEIGLTPMINNGSAFLPKTTTYVPEPYEGDSILSPSGGLIISRVAGAGFKQNGYTLRRVDATPNGGGYDVQLPEVGRYCFQGGKPGFSFDERWVVLHRYVTDADAVELGFTGPNDPAFDAYQASGASNIYLVDLLTGERRRITNMSAGQYALYPHFRSDGWIYFMVRSTDTTDEHIVASDAMLVVEQGGG
ncbi:MAG: hypothetical protein U0271_14905 [Polyangiaceae bacterium]